MSKYYCRIGSGGSYYHASPDKMWLVKLFGVYFTENTRIPGVIDYIIYASILPYNKLSTILNWL